MQQLADYKFRLMFRHSIASTVLLNFKLTEVMAFTISKYLTHHLYLKEKFELHFILFLHNS